MRFYISVIFTALILSNCGGGGVKKIPLDQVDVSMKRAGENMANDIFYLTTQRDGIEEFKRRKYITTKVHVNITGGAYSQTGFLINMHLGKVDSFKLFEVVDKGLIKIFRYKVFCKNFKGKFVELRLKINKNKNLAEYNIYLPGSKSIFEVNELRI